MRLTETVRAVRAVLICMVLACWTQPDLARAESNDVLAELARHPLEPVDTSSPRATMESFRDNLRAASQVALRGGPSADFERLALRAFRTLEMSGRDGALAAGDDEDSLARGRRLKAGGILMGILERIELPPLEAIPDATEVEARGLTSWTVPRTEIVIAKVEHGPRAGEWLFSPATLARLPAFWTQVEALPVREQVLMVDWANRRFESESEWPAVQSAVDRLPEPMREVLLGVAIWKWLATAIIMLVGVGLVSVALRLGRSWDRRHDRPWMRFGKPVAWCLILVLLPIVERLLVDGVNLPYRVTVPATIVLDLAYYVVLSIFVATIAARAGDVLIQGRSLRPAGVDASLVRLTTRVVAIVLAIYVVIWGSERLGVPVTPLLAGLGVGGLAIALAVRPTLENVLGGFVLFADKPVRVGDFCVFGDKMGTVEEVGLRSTRIRALDRTVITVPNAEFSQLQLVNFTRRDKMLYRLTLSLRYETTPDQLRLVMAKIREMLIRHERVAPDPARVRFMDFGASSLDLEIFAYVSMSDYNEYLGVREDLNLRIMDIVAESGTGFAFPSQTVYLGRDGGLDAERVRKAEAEVEAWRKDGRLPFPEFEEEERARMTDTLGYPPEGSPHATAAGQLELRPTR